MNLFEESY